MPFYLGAGAAMLVLVAVFIFIEGSLVRGLNTGRTVPAAEKKAHPAFPSFYRGIYLSNDSAFDPARFRRFLDAAEKSGINTLVMDVQTSRYRERMVPREHIEESLARGIHPVARVVVFPGGLSVYPPRGEFLAGIIDTAERAAKAGFREIQFDYIRFSDERRHASRLKGVTTKERYRFIGDFLTKARARLEPYGVRIAADVFGRVPHRIDDRIGQKMEVFDTHADVICPMAYPSHYWTKKLRHDPYGTVLWTSTEADRKTGRADIVTWIQAFKMQHPPSMSLADYIEHQIRAVHDAKVKGYLLWNARQDYGAAFEAVASYYGDRSGGIASGGGDYEKR